VGVPAIAVQHAAFAAALSAPRCAHEARPGKQDRAGLRYPAGPARHLPPGRDATAMPSFDIVSEVDTHELTNAVDQANRELGNRFDFKGVDARFEREDAVIRQSAPSEFQVRQMTEILRARLAARGIDARCLQFGEIQSNLAGARQEITVRQGIGRELAKKIQAALKEAKLKVDSQINGDKLRVSGKKRDDLQAAIALLRGAEFEQPLQFDNFRD
jgi:cyclic-di-GMP-binding protein